MKLEGKEIPHREHYGPEWEKAMLDLDKHVIVKLLKQKGLAELGGVSSGEGLQIQRYCQGMGGKLERHNKGYYCAFSDAERFHSIAQETIGKNMLLATKISSLKKQIETQAGCNRELTEGLEKAAKQRDDGIAEKKQLVEALRLACGRIDGDNDCRKGRYCTERQCAVFRGLKAAGEEV